MDRGTKNVLVICLGLTLVYASFYGFSNCQKIILDSFKLYKINAYLGLALNYAGFAFGAFISPMTFLYFSTRQLLVAGLTMLSLLGLPLIYPYPLTVYILDFMSGMGVGPLWSALGWIISCSSTTRNLDRNLGLVFFFYMLGPTLGDLFIFFSFTGKTVISDEVRYFTVIILSVIGFLGPLMIIFFDESALESTAEQNDELEPLVRSNDKQTPQKSIKDALGKISATLELASTNSTMLLLEPLLIFSGIEMAIWSGVLGTCIGNYTFEAQAKPLMGLSGVFVGIGEIVASLSRTFLPRFLRPNRIRYFATFSSTTGINTALLLMHFYLPPATVQHEVSSAADVTKYYEVCMVLTGFLFGFSDSFIQSEICACMSVWFPEADANNSAFSIYLTVQALGGGFLFGLSTFSYLNNLLIVAAASSFFSTVGILIADYKNRAELGNSGSIQDCEEIQ